MRNINSPPENQPKRAQLDEGTLRLLLLDTAKCLAHLKKSGWWHGDLAPANVIIDDLGVFKLIDLGNSRPLDPSKTRQDNLPRSERIFNPVFVSPEYLKDGVIGFFNDIHSLGLTIYHACICNHQDIDNLIVKALDWQPADLALWLQKHPLPAHLSPVFRETVMAMMDPDFTKRPTADELVSMEWLSETGVECQRQRVRTTFAAVPTDEQEGLHKKYEDKYEADKLGERDPIAQFTNTGGYVYTQTTTANALPEPPVEQKVEVQAAIFEQDVSQLEENKEDLLHEIQAAEQPQQDELTEHVNPTEDQ